MARCRLILAAVPFGLIVSACGGAAIVEAPAYAPKDQVTSRAAVNPAQPLVVDWPSADRGKLESRISSGLVVVRYAGGTMALLDRCSVSRGSYTYRAFTQKRDRVEMRDRNAMSAWFPTGAVARLEGELRTGRALDVDMTVVGRWEGDNTSVRTADLQGFCNGATHVVAAMTVGAFTLSAGGDASVDAGGSVLAAGVRASSETSRVTLNQDGDEAKCGGATTSDWSPPEGCRAPIRVEVLSLAEGDKLPQCTQGEVWNGSQCVSENSGAGALILAALLLL